MNSQVNFLIVNFTSSLICKEYQNILLGLLVSFYFYFLFFIFIFYLILYILFKLEPGIYHGNIVFGSQDTIMDGPTLTSFPNLSNQNNRPISMVLTEFHFVLLYPDRIVCVGRLNQQKVHESFFPPVIIFFFLLSIFFSLPPINK